MIHPSYVELMKVVNEGVEIGEEPVVNSRYSIVLATAKRARQIIDGAKPMETTTKSNKPLSIAVEELFHGDVKIVSEEDENRTGDNPHEENQLEENHFEEDHLEEDHAGDDRLEDIGAEDENAMVEKE